MFFVMIFKSCLLEKKKFLVLPKSSKLFNMNSIQTRKYLLQFKASFWVNELKIIKLLIVSKTYWIIHNPLSFKWLLNVPLIGYWGIVCDWWCEFLFQWSYIVHVTEG